MISIKTVDGMRYDLQGRTEIPEAKMIRGIPKSFFIRLPCPDSTRYVNINHIVCITVRDDEGKVS